MYAVIGFWVAFFCTVKSWFSFSNANNSGFSLTVWCPITVYILALNPLILDIRVWHSVELHPSPDSKENTSRVCTTQTDRFALHIVLTPLKPITPSLLLYEPNFAAFRNPERAGERTSLTDRSRHRASVNTTLPIKPTGTVRLYSSHINKGRGRQRSVSFPSQYPNSQKDQCT